MTTSSVPKGRPRLSLQLVLLVLTSYLSTLYSWMPPRPSLKRIAHSSSRVHAHAPNHVEPPPLRRISVAGMSVSPDGFWVIFQCSPDEFWPIQVTESQEDTVAATSLESLTLLQLLNGVDLAGPILPPELLSQLAIEHAEGSESLQVLLNELKLPPDVPSYSELNEWQKSRTILPQVTLDAIEISVQDSTVQWMLACRSPSTRGFYFSPEDTSRTHLAFTCVSLALRYQAPMNMAFASCGDEELMSLEEIQHRFPLYTSTGNLRKPANRVQKNLQQGFEIHKLTGALKMAMERGDTKAASLIREKLDEYDSFENLPTIPNSDYDQLQ